jgi:hypothetical protein
MSSFPGGLGDPGTGLGVTLVRFHFVEETDVSMGESPCARRLPLPEGKGVACNEALKD